MRYDDPVLKLPWGTKPEGYCRNYDDGATNCPWRFDSTPPPDSPTREHPRGRDYYGGDLQGVTEQLDYLQALGVNTIYFNPIFDAGSNHCYDTQDYYKIDPYFGTQKDCDDLVQARRARGHPDRPRRRLQPRVVGQPAASTATHHYPTAGACESTTSPYRTGSSSPDRPDGPCAGASGPPTSDLRRRGSASTDPGPHKTHAAVQAYFLTDGEQSRQVLADQGAAGWRLDVMGDASFPDGYWETFRDVVKTTDPQALTSARLAEGHDAAAR